MAYTTPATAVTGDVITAAFWNTNGRDNILETAVAKATAAGDTFHATATNVLARLAKPATPAGDVYSFAAGASAPSWTTSYVLNGLRGNWRANRQIVAEYAAAHSNGSGAVGVGLYSGGAGAGAETIAAISGEPTMEFSSAGAATADGVYSSPAGNGTFGVMLSPAKSPRMFTRVLLPAASANLTSWLCGFFDADSLTANGAYLRIATTGNVFFVTRQGGAETTTDLGALTRTTALTGFEIETTDAGVTWVCRNQAGTQLASHNTNVPTAATALGYGLIATTAAAVTYGLSQMHIEGTFA